MDAISGICWDICPHFHGMSDMGYKSGTREFGRSHTNNAECYAFADKVKCERNGNCVLARKQNWSKVNKSSW